MVLITQVSAFTATGTQPAWRIGFSTWHILSLVCAYVSTLFFLLSPVSNIFTVQQKGLKEKPRKIHCSLHPVGIRHRNLGKKHMCMFFLYMTIFNLYIYICFLFVTPLCRCPASFDIRTATPRGRREEEGSSGYRPYCCSKLALEYKPGKHYTTQTG